MCELLGGALSGTGATSEGRPFANGMLSIFIDPLKLDPGMFFPGEVQRYVDYVKSSKPASEEDEILMPGEMEERHRRQRLADGVPLPDDTWQAIVECALGAGIERSAVPAVR
jgi:uncharacterized oxidoreductase